MDTITVKAGAISLRQIRELTFNPVTIALAAGDYRAIDDSNVTVNALCRADEASYGINTGFGRMAQTRIDNDKLTELQHNLVLSHCCGVGPRLDEGIVRLILLLKILSLARGYSGVRREVVDALLALLNAQVYPCIPAKGSVGASGDLAPLAHMSAVLTGVGEVSCHGEILSAEAGLVRAGLTPLTLGPKEGLALINGTQVSTAIALFHFFSVEKIFAAAVLTGAMSVDAMRGSDAPFDPRIQALRGHRGQIDVAAVYRSLLAGSEIRQSHLDCEKVQDPYSLRCQPQVMGAILDSMRHVAGVLTIEANAVTDNPLIFNDTREALSGGNFHAEPVALVADQLAVAAAEIGAIAERRLANLVDPDLSRLPPFLVEDPGLHSGFMIAQVTAASLASENKSLAHPASVDSLPTSANQEDHVSMATFAARRLGDMVDNLNGIIAIELLAAAQAIEFHRPCRSSTPLEMALGSLRERVPHYDRDRYFAPDIEAAKDLVLSSAFTEPVTTLLPGYA